jgi:hypothetical protein
LLKKNGEDYLNVTYPNFFRSFFEQVAAKKEPKKRRWRNFAPAGATKGCAPLDGRSLFEKSDAKTFMMDLSVR